MRRSVAGTAAGVVGLLLLVAGVWWVLESRARVDAVFEANERAMLLLREEVEASDDHRLTLGPPVAGVDARTLYDEILPRLAELDAEESGLLYMDVWEEARTQTWYEEDEALIQGVLRRSRPLLDRLRAVQTAATLSRPSGWDRWPSRDMEEDPPWDTFSEILSAQVQRDVIRGEVEDALDLCVLRWFAGLDLARHGALVGYLRGLNLAKTSIREARWILAECDVPSERLDRLAAELDTLRRSTPRLEDALRVDEVQLRVLFSGPDAGGTEFGVLDRVLLVDALEELGPAYEALIAATEGKPGRAAHQAADAVRDEIEDGASPVLGMIVVGLAVGAGKEEETLALHDLLRVTVALARYRAAHGRMPDDLAALVPDLLAEIPVCAYSGEPLRYDGERVWSVGGDGVDDGGVALGYDDDIDDKGDVVFTLRTHGLRRFPWDDDVETTTRERAEAALGELLAGGDEAEESGDVLVELGREVCGRLIGEFARLAEDPGFESAGGRALAGRIDRTLRRIDGFLEHRWQEARRVQADSDPAFVRTIAERWTNWWAREAWRLDPQEPWEPEEEEGD